MKYFRDCATKSTKDCHNNSNFLQPQPTAVPFWSSERDFLFCYISIITVVQALSSSDKKIAMTKISFNNEALIETLQTRIPEIKEFLYPEILFSAYICYGTFGSLLRDEIIRENKNKDLIERSFLFINYLIENGDKDVLTMLRVATFEILTDYEETIITAKKYLMGNALQIFLEVVKLLK